MYIGGILNMLFVIFHLSFWTLFDWQQGLVSLSSDNRAIIQVLNIHTAYVLFVFAILSFVFANEMISVNLGRFVALAIAIFWGLRAVNQALFWNASSAESWMIIFVCLVMALLYLIPGLNFHQYKKAVLHKSV